MLVCKVKDPIAIKLLIAKTGKSLRQFSKQINISHPYLSQILNCKKNPSPTIAYKISDALGKDITDLFIVEEREEITS